MKISPSQKILQAVKHRRVDFPSQLLRCTTVPHRSIGVNRMKLLQWIGKHTEGRFYIEYNTVLFEKESDAILFKLGYKI